MKKIWVIRNLRTGKYIARFRSKKIIWVSDINKAEIWDKKPYQWVCKKNDEVAIQVEIVPIEWSTFAVVATRKK